MCARARAESFADFVNLISANSTSGLEGSEAASEGTQYGYSADGWFGGVLQIRIR